MGVFLILFIWKEDYNSQFIKVKQLNRITERKYKQIADTSFFYCQKFKKWKGEFMEELKNTDNTFNFVVFIMYFQLFNLLCDKADDVYSGRLSVHVKCLLDKFANIVLIPKFEKLIATIRSRKISASIILQTQSQLKTIYKDSIDTIIGNCDNAYS